MISRPRRNRVNPFGKIVAISQRGGVMGNRGDIHQADGTISNREWRGQRWITCTLITAGPKVIFDTPGHYTPLFFLDEAVAFAAGHRPCAHCRRSAFKLFTEIWAYTQNKDYNAKVDEIDAVLSDARIKNGLQRTFFAAPDQLPEGVFIVQSDAPNTPLLLQSGSAFPWSECGYGKPAKLNNTSIARVLTPKPLVQMLREGYQLDIFDHARS